MDYDERRDHAHAIASALGACLVGWEYVPQRDPEGMLYPAARLQNVDGDTIVVDTRYGAAPGDRVRFGAVPNLRSNDGQWQGFGAPEKAEITCSLSKPYDVMARDVERRLLPKARELFAECKRVRDERNAYLDRQADTTNTMSGFCRVRQRQPGDTPHGFVSLPGEARYIEIKIAGERVELHVHGLSAEQAAEVLRTLGVKEA